MPWRLVLAFFILHLWELEYFVEGAVVRSEAVLCVIGCWLDMLLRSIDINTAGTVDLHIEGACLWSAAHVGPETFFGMGSCTGAILNNIGLTSSIVNLVSDFVSFEGIEIADFNEVVFTLSHCEKLILAVWFGSLVWSDTNRNDLNVRSVECLGVSCTWSKLA